MKTALKTILLLVLVGMASCTHDPINPPAPVEPGACHPDTVYFENDILPVIAANCASSGCHSDNNPADGISLTTYAGIKDEVKPGDPMDSELYKVLFETGDDLMPPAPASPLSAATKDLIKTWIEEGALNNACSDCDTTSGSFSQTVLPMITGQCQSCHSGSNLSGGVDLSTHATIVDAVNNSNLLNAIERTSYYPMPPAMALSDCEVEQIKVWISNGMPNN